MRKEITMGPERGSAEYEAQAEQVRAFLRNIDARTADDEDQIIVLFATDPSYSRDAIMDGLGRWRTELRDNAPKPE
jgi:hypothetical protein